MASKLPPCPPQLRAVQHYLKLASDYEARNPTISYWARLFALQSAIKIDRKSAEAKNLLAGLMDWLETFKKSNTQNESITSDIAAQAVVENEANKLFVKADSEDRAAQFNKNTVKFFYTAGILFDVCEVFGELTEEVTTQRKYAKWKATYIHNCLKSGETPIPGPMGGDEDELESFNLPTPQQDDHEKISNIPESGNNLGFSLPPINTSEKTPEASMPPSAQQYGYAPQEPPKTQVSADLINKAQKFCKYAISALDYEDTKTAVDNLQKALAILT